MANEYNKFPELKNPPILEAIFEIRWHVSKENFGLIDKDFKFFPGRFYELIREKYPLVEVLESNKIPDEMNPYIPRFRFRAEPNMYPLIQVGPGMLSVNLNKEKFSQDKFHKTCNEVLNKFYILMKHVKIIQIQIHYIDGFAFDYENENAFHFIEEKLNTTFKFSKGVFTETEIEEIPTKFNIEANYPVKDPEGIFMFRLRSGIKKSDKSKLILMDTLLISSNIEDLNEIKTWIIKSDVLIHKWFFKIIENMKELF